MLRQQQELFAKAREAEVMKEQAQLAAVGQAAQFAAVSTGAEDYS